MPDNIQINYVNRSPNKDTPKIFVFTRNEVPKFEIQRQGVEWKVITNLGRNSSYVINYPVDTEDAENTFSIDAAAANDQKPSFVPHPKLYWGMAPEIQEGQEIDSAMLNPDSFFELDLEGVSEVTVALCGNEEDGYQFKIEDQR